MTSTFSFFLRRQDLVIGGFVRDHDQTTIGQGVISAEGYTQFVDCCVYFCSDEVSVWSSKSGTGVLFIQLRKYSTTNKVNIFIIMIVM